MLIKDQEDVKSSFAKTDNSIFMNFQMHVFKLMLDGLDELEMTE